MRAGLSPSRDSSAAGPERGAVPVAVPQDPATRLRVPVGPSGLSPTIKYVSVPISIFVRLQHDQWSFARERARAYGGAIVWAKHVAPYPSDHHSHGQPGDRVAQAVVGVKRHLVVDPGTHQLCSKGAPRYPSAARLRNTGAASVLTLPLTPDQLADPSVRDSFVDASMHDQRLANAVAAPYLEPRSRRDERHLLNIQMLRRVIRSAGTQTPIAFLAVTRSKLIAGLVPQLVPDYAATGVERVYLRVREGGEKADAVEVRAWLQAIDAFKAHGVEVFPDCVGRLGPILVHGGAAGFSTGTDFFRTAAKPLLSRGGGGGGTPVSIESPNGWSELARDSGDIAAMGPCPDPDCPVGRREASLDDLREHRLHTLDRLARRAADQDTLGLVRSLRASGQPRAREWADVLVERSRRVA